MSTPFWPVAAGLLDIKDFIGRIVNWMQLPSWLILFAPVAAAALVIVVLAMIGVYWHHCRRYRQLHAALDALKQGGQEIIAENEALRRKSGRAIGEITTVLDAVSSAERQIATLTSLSDFRTFDDVVQLRAAIGELRGALQDLSSGASGGHIVDLLHDGLDGGDWLHPILRSELLLRYLAPPGPWSALAIELSLIAALARTQLLRSGVEVASPLLFMPLQHWQDELDGSDELFARVEFARKAVTKAIRELGEPRALVVDCLRFGSRVSAGTGARYQVNSKVALFHPENR